MIDIKELAPIEQFISNYLCEFDKQLPEIESNILDTNIIEILKAGWCTISKNSVWYLKNYRANTGNDENIFPIPYCELCFACRILMETSSDVWYLLRKDNKFEIEKFLSEKKALENDFESTIKNISGTDYPKNYSLQKGTMKRIEECYREQGLAHYNSLCWNTHFNYVGYTIIKNELLTYKLRIYNLLFLIETINKFFDSIKEICCLEKYTILTKIRDGSDEVADRIKKLIRKENKNV